jgi:Family of unknown function (DUF6521)
VTSLAWERRPLEERANYNPAFLALLLREAADGYITESQRTLPVPLAFLALPLVLHRTTRESLPKIISTSMPIWLQEHPFLREGFVARVRAVAPAVREALVTALTTGLLELDRGALTPAAEPGKARHATTESRAVAARARFVGRWLSRAGDIDTIFFLWGVKP